jgi:3-oxoacyl-[acyl-carrier protein] reductase
MDFGINGKHALVTGGSRGLGREAALALAREGVDVGIVARNQDQLDATSRELSDLGAEAATFAFDLADTAGIDRLAEMVRSTLGPIDILVNNVGGSLGTSDLLASSMDDFALVMDTNLWPAVRLMQHFLPDMREKKWGRIVNITSIWGREYGGTAPYMTAKAAVIAATKHTAVTVAPDGVTVNAIAPGSIFIEGGFWDRWRLERDEAAVDEFIERNLPMGRFGWPEAIGSAVAFLASEQAGLITGACINIDGGQSRSLV